MLSPPSCTSREWPSRWCDYHTCTYQRLDDVVVHSILDVPTLLTPCRDEFSHVGPPILLPRLRP